MILSTTSQRLFLQRLVNHMHSTHPHPFWEVLSHEKDYKILADQYSSNILYDAIVTFD
jgi:hypothetical protein